MNAVTITMTLFYWTVRALFMAGLFYIQKVISYIVGFQVNLLAFIIGLIVGMLLGPFFIG